MATLLTMRSLVAARNPFDDAKETLSSWDKCMEKAYCKWPVIAAIIIGGIIVLSVVLCIARCICCGAELACCCFKCCTCCCPSGGRSAKAAKPPSPRPYDQSAYTFPPAPSQQYRSHVAPTFNPVPPQSAPTFNPVPPQSAPTFNPVPPPSAPTFNPAPMRAPATYDQHAAPTFARFDASQKPANEDALPAMPVWRDAKSVHVEEEVIPEKHDDVELAPMAAGGHARRSPGSARSPVQRIQTEDGYGYPSGYSNDPYANAPSQRSPHHSPGGYGAAHSQQSFSPVYGAGAGHVQNQYSNYHNDTDPGSPIQSYYDQQPQSQQQYGAASPVRMPSPQHGNNYGYTTTGNYQEPPHVSPFASSNDMYSNTYAPPPLPDALRAASPGQSSPAVAGYAPPLPSASPAPAYPGQQTYESSDAFAQPAQAPYRAYTPAQSATQVPQYTGVSRKPIEGSWKEV